MIRTVALPEDLYNKAVELATREHISVDEFVAAALADQVAGREYMDKRARRFSQEKFESALAQIPDHEPEEYDRI
jgi:hypothetical protein